MIIRVNSWVKIFLLASCCVFTAQAELQWEHKTVCLDVYPLQVEAKTAFHCTNTGAEPIDILSIQTSCGCLKAAANTNRIAPGESESIDVVFDFRDKTGPQRKAVAVRSSDAPAKPTVLYLEANIPEVYTFDTERLEWPLNGKLELKVCRMVNRLKEPVRLISVSSSSEQFAVELKPVREGFEYEVLVHPVESSIPGLAVVTVQTECPPGLKEFRVYSFSASLR